MSDFNSIFNDLVISLSKFPGIGKRSAERIALHILKMDNQAVQDLARQMGQIKELIKPCKLCNNFSTQEVCSICSSSKRDNHLLCVVEEPKDIIAIEKTARFNGLYYVLLGSISPFDGVGIENLNIGKLLNRVQEGTIKEIIISTDPDNDGELTAQYLIKKLSKFNVKIYRIAIGIPLGTQIEYIDSATLGKALLERKLV